MKKEVIKTEIRKAYGNIAKSESTPGGCCGTDADCCGSENTVSMAEEYSAVNGYVKEADMSLGCGLPTEIANINLGDTVVDLGSGAGNDVFIARSIVGDTGKVIGLDMTPEMVIKALQNNQKLGYTNVEFILGEIENMNSISSSTADVVISNCVMNLVPDKEKAFKEVHRILKTGGHFSISDIVHVGTLPDGLLEAAEMYSGCVAGASEKGAYLGIIKQAGFKSIQIKKERKIELPDDLLLKYISVEELNLYKQTNAGLYSLTVYADKLEEGDCCETTEGGCCSTAESKSDEVVSSCCGSGSGSGCC